MAKTDLKHVVRRRAIVSFWNVGRSWNDEPMEEKFMELTLTEDPNTPAGMLTTPAGRIVLDDGHGRLVQLLDEAYELHNDHVVVSIVGRDPYQLFVSDHLLADGSVELADDIRVLVGGTIAEPRDDGDGLVVWCGGHTIDNVRTERFRIDGYAARIQVEDVMANVPPYRN